MNNNFDALLNVLARAYIDDVLTGTGTKITDCKQFLMQGMDNPNQFKNMLDSLEDKNSQVTLSATWLTMILKELHDIDKQKAQVESRQMESNRYRQLLSEIHTAFTDRSVKDIGERRKNVLKEIGYSGAITQKDTAQEWLDVYWLRLEGDYSEASREKALRETAEEYGLTIVAMYKAISREKARQVKAGKKIPTPFLPSNPTNKIR